MGLTIIEVKTTLSGERKQFDCELCHRDQGHVVVSYRMPKTIHLEGIRLPRNTLSLGYFWEDRAYNVYHWVDKAGQTLALYFNICDNTRISSAEVAWRDLTVDVLITTDLQCRVLDEDELPDDLNPELHRYINRVRAALCADPRARLLEIENLSHKLLAQA